MQRPWREWLIVLGGCAVLALGGGCGGSSLRCQQPRGCDPDRLAAAHALEEGEVVLTPDQVQRGAVFGAGQASALEAGRSSNDEDGCGGGCLRGGGSKPARLRRRLKAYFSDEVRNQRAGAALQNYYRLAQARLQLPLADEAVGLSERLVAQGHEFLKKGLTPPEEMTRLERQLLMLRADRLKLEVARDRLTEQLRVLGDGSLRACRIATLEVFHVLDEPIDVEKAIGIGLAHRAELNLLRAALCDLDASTLPVIRQLLGGTNPLLGNQARRCLPFLECLPRLIPILATREIERVREQLEELICERERQVATDIRVTVLQICSQVRLVQLAQAREQQARKRLAELEERARKGQPTEADMTVARRDHLQTRTDVLSETIAWELARVELRRTQGMLVREVLASPESGCDCHP